MTTTLQGSAWDRLVDPLSLAETVLRVRDRLERLQFDRRGPIDDADVPHFVRIAADGRQNADWIAERVGRVYGVRPSESDLNRLFTTDPEARDALAYWLLGLTEMSTGDVARACRLGGEGEAAAAMRRHANRSGFPVLDLTVNVR